MDCIFCKLAQGIIPTDQVYEDGFVFAFRDMEPQAPTHLLFIPKEHIASANEITPENADVIAKIFVAIQKVAKEMGFDETGYRVVNNCGKHGQQSVQHLHFHVMAGRQMTWPAG